MKNVVTHKIGNRNLIRRMFVSMSDAAAYAKKHSKKATIEIFNCGDLIEKWECGKLSHRWN